MVRDMSEDGGFFRADAFASNETGYLHVLGPLRSLGACGGAYVGVGPEQNFSYIAAVRPEIAFLVDIRREVLIQHLMYKAIFRHARNRAEFLALLFSRTPGIDLPAAPDSVVGQLDAIASVPAAREQFAGNLALIRRTIEDAFLIPLASADAQRLEHVYGAFWRAGPDIRYGPGFASLRELILETDLAGQRGNFLADEAAYAFVRQLQERNRVIPLVGDFAGAKALAGVADYLGRHGLTLTVFYLSNVEEYLFQDRTFGRFADNVRRFAIDDRSVFVRSLRAGWAERHPANTRGLDRMSLVATISAFLQDYGEGACSNYWKLVTRNYVGSAPSAPKTPRGE